MTSTFHTSIIALFYHIKANLRYPTLRTT